MSRASHASCSGELVREPISVGFVSLGCAKNLVDSQVMAGEMLAGGLRLAPSPEEAQVILVNTCAFIEDARTESAEAIIWACEHKRAGGCAAVVVAGCMSQRYRGRLRRSFPGVDAVIGLDQLDSVAAVIRKVAAGERVRTEISSRPWKSYNPPRPALVFSGGPHAYLKIAEGCDHGCSFCAIPAIRGRQRSRSPDDLVDEAQALLTAGFSEIDLVAQDVTGYGRDRQGKCGLPALLRRLDDLAGDFWLRLLYGYPAHVTPELLATMAGGRHILPYLDIPIQHSHPDILRAMGRADTLGEVPGMCRRLRQAVPGIFLRTTCLVGFPGETEAHFQHLLQSVESAQFDHLGVFVFSPEEGTAACQLPDRPPPEVAGERRHRLMLAQRLIARRKLRLGVGETATALLEQPLAGPRSRGVRWRARVASQAPEVDGITRVAGVPAEARPGSFIRVRITGFRGYDLRAAFLDNQGPEKGKS